MNNDQLKGVVGKAIIQHFYTKTEKTVTLVKVDEDDCLYRFIDGSELANEWNVIRFAPIKTN